MTAMLRMPRVPFHPRWRLAWYRSLALPSLATTSLAVLQSTIYTARLCSGGDVVLLPLMEVLLAPGPPFLLLLTGCIRVTLF